MSVSPIDEPSVPDMVNHRWQGSDGSEAQCVHCIHATDVIVINQPRALAGSQLQQTHSKGASVGGTISTYIDSRVCESSPRSLALDCHASAEVPVVMYATSVPTHLTLQAFTAITDRYSGQYASSVYGGVAT